MSYTSWPLTDEQNDIIELCRTFAKDKIRPAGPGVDEADTESPVELFREAARVGITDFMIPEEYGGGGFTDVFTQCLVQEQLCFGDPGIGNLLCSNGFFADPVLALGTEEQKETWLRPLTGPDPVFTALATTEPGSGSDSASITTRAEPVEGGYLLNGQKVWISNAGLAEGYVVFAKTDTSQRSRGVSAFLLPRDTEGMEFGAPMKKMGQRAIVCREIFFSDAFVPSHNRLGEEGQGFYGLMRTFDISRVVLGAASLGTARAAYEYARDYARERTQFGKPIIDHQAVAFRLADMAARIDSAWLQVLNAARMIDAGDAVPREKVTAAAAMAKLNASETAMFCTWAGIQTL
ncbi:MAG: acyl-CoA dehydrogenase family protein, partial [Brevibacterium sp.]|nr:acyl-CoA dehydrogenase family protein [Brevibacterium sp.]